MAKFLNKMLYYIGLQDDMTNENEGEFINYEDKEKVISSVKKMDKKNKLVNIHTASQINVVVYKPVSYDDTQDICNNLKNRKPVIVNLQELDAQLAQRVLDFLSGAVYAINGSIQKICVGIFVLAPSNVDVTGNLMENDDYLIDFLRSKR